MASPPYEMSTIDRDHQTLQPRSTSPVYAQETTNDAATHYSTPDETHIGNVNSHINHRDPSGFYHSPSASLHNEVLPAYSPKPAEQKKTKRLGKDRWGFWLAWGFSSLVLLQWIGLVYTCYRPFRSRHTYEEAAMNHYNFALNERWLETFGLLRVILSLFLITVTSAVLSRAAVFLTQRSTMKHEYSLAQILAIADEGWTSLPILFRSFVHKDSQSLYLIYGFSLCVVAILIYPIQQGFLEIKLSRVPSVSLKYYTYGIPDANAEPILYHLYETDGEISYASSLSEALIRTGPFDDQPSLWNSSYSQEDFSRSSYMSADISPGLQEKLSDPLTSFVAIQNNTYNNGLYNSTGLRMNTSVICEDIPRSEFPTTCPGSEPWSREIQMKFVNDSILAEAMEFRELGVDTLYSTSIVYGVQLKVCVAGNQYSFPWLVNTTLQTISEEMFFDINWIASSLLYDPRAIQNYTKRCTANTTAGYFELPNYTRNESSALLPADYGITDATTPEETINNYSINSYYQPNWADDVRMLNYHSPLLSTAIAFFPDWTGIVDDIGGLDQNLGIQWPLHKFTRSTRQNESYVSYLSRFSVDPTYLEKSLRIGAFLSTTSALETAKQTFAESLVYGHAILADIGMTVKRPYLPFPVIVIVSILVAYLTISLLYLGFLLAFKRTWTSSLDSLAIMMLSKDATDQMPRMPVILHGSSTPRTDVTHMLAKYPGVIGDLLSEEPEGMLAIGAEGVIGTNNLSRRRYGNEFRLPIEVVNQSRP